MDPPIQNALVPLAFAFLPIVIVIVLAKHHPSDNLISLCTRIIPKRFYQRFMVDTFILPDKSEIVLQDINVFCFLRINEAVYYLPDAPVDVLVMRIDNDRNVAVFGAAESFVQRLGIRVNSCQDSIFD
eukprot:CAMPEP_0201128560 /NCGR_PEP_ID=MMETSP0850-20130426/34119_1 /ASSEMBLY_ACC=CAM_ASM_000622 /TAXON_ID=183588 /ORGANISM="Pseudo-nitzschia fraudulenta, Strain WWA7" /LENGTH=127 /DNA_ID=CAMNT_0047397785 /DNA_START=648 /DNA_END=1032 /DNA_ORIENTATION=-